MPTVDTALVYPGGCLIEGTNLSEGRGTTRPFEIVGAPWIDGRALAAGLARHRPRGLRRPRAHLPADVPEARRHVCGGVQIHVTDAAAFRPVATYVALVRPRARPGPRRASASAPSATSTWTTSPPSTS